MANKRNASTDLNHDNWDDDEEHETSGRFQTAQPSVIASRQIKLATRRLNNSSDSASDTSKEACHEMTPTETIFKRLGANFASGKQDKKKTTFFTSRVVAYKPTPVLSNTNPELPNTPQPESPVETNTNENKRSKQDNVITGEESPETSAFRPVNPANSSSTPQVGLPIPVPAVCGSMVDPTSVEKPDVSSNHDPWRKLTAIKLPHSLNQGSDPSSMPCLETRPVDETESCASSTDADILGKKDSRHLLKPVPDDILARLKAKSEATAKSLNFLKRTYQLNTTTLDWLHILVKESLTVNIAEVIPSYMHELVKLIEEEIASQESDEAKEQLLPHKNQLQQMLAIFKQFGYLAEGEKSSKSGTLPEGANKTSTSNTPMITKKLESSPQSTNSFVTHKDTLWKMKNADQEVQQTPKKVQNEPDSMALSKNQTDNQQDCEQTENEDDDSSKADSFTPVVEEGSVCTMRCKVFVKKVLDPSDPFDTPYQNRGVGSLFIKPISRGKLQLVIRADNSLGNIILNTCITPDIPIEIANSNTLMLVCCPMPGDIARTVLIRVKNKVHVDLLHINLVTI